MQKVDVLIVIEHVARELESACLLKVALQQRGYLVAIDGIYPNKEKLPTRYQADYLLIPWAYHDHDMDFWECFYHHSPNIQIINLHHEQYSGNDSHNTTLPQGRSRKIYHLSWGTRFTEGLLTSGVDPSHIIPAGNLRLDFYRPPLTGLSQNRTILAERFELDAKKDWVLFIANAYHLMRPSERDNARRIDQNIDTKSHIAKQNLTQFLAMVRQYLATNQDKIFIYRPHPAYAMRENENSELKKLTRQFPHQFKVIYANTLGDWILASQCCLSFHSTSGIECSLAKIPFYLFRTTPLPDTLDYSFYRHFPNMIRNEEDFTWLMRTGGKPVDPSLFAQHYYLQDQPAYELLIHWIETHHDQIDQAVSRQHILRNQLKAYSKDTLRLLAKLPLFKSYFQTKQDGRWTRLLQTHDDLLDPAIVDALCQTIRTIIEEEHT